MASPSEKPIIDVLGFADKPTIEILGSTDKPMIVVLSGALTHLIGHWGYVGLLQSGQRSMRERPSM